MAYITRKEWGARPARGGGNKLLSNVLGTGIHWYGGSVAGRVRHHHQCAGVVRSIQADHQDGNGWADIAYSDLVCPHGDIFEGRGKGNGSAAFGNSFHNARYYATCALWGKGDGPVNRNMLEGIAEAVDLHRSWGARKDVIGHRDATRTECPGDELYSYIQAGRFTTWQAPSDIPRPRKKKPTSSSRPSAKGISVQLIDCRTVTNAAPATGPGVKPMQRLLSVTVDGMAGVKTRAALGAAQKRAGVAVDYVWGPKTATALLAGK